MEKAKKPITFSLARLKIPCPKCINISKTNTPIDIIHSNADRYEARGFCEVCKEPIYHLLNQNQIKNFHLILKILQ